MKSLDDLYLLLKIESSMSNNGANPIKAKKGMLPVNGKDKMRRIPADMLKVNRCFFVNCIIYCPIYIE